MAVVTRDLLSNILENVRAIFNEEFLAAQDTQAFRNFTTVVTSTTESEVYDWFGSVPTMQDVTHGPLILGGLNKYNFTITNRLFKNGFPVSRRALEFDRLGQIPPKTRQLVDEAIRFQEQLVVELLETNGNAFDGTAFFANTRTLGSSANIDNLAAGAGTTAANIRTDLAAVRATMLRFQDDNGRPMKLSPTHLLIPPELQGAFWEALNAIQGTGTQEAAAPASVNGVWQARNYTVIESPYLTDTNNWYAFRPGRDINPLILQTVGAPTLEADTDPNSAHAIINDEYIYSARMQCEAGYGDPRTAICVVN